MELNQQQKFVLTYARAAQGLNVEKQRSYSLANPPTAPMPLDSVNAPTAPMPMESKKEIINERSGSEDDPKHWLEMAKLELELGNLCQASEKAYMAGRKALDIFAKRNGIELESHDAANYFMRCLCNQEHPFPRGEPYNTLHETWDFNINGAHWNFFNATWGRQTIVKTFDKVSDFIHKMKTLPLLDKVQKKYILNIRNNKLMVEKPTSESGPWIIRNKGIADV